MGTVFQLTPPAAAGGAWNLSTLYTFQGGKDGSFPLFGVLVAKNGSLLYVTAGAGGTSQDGTIYSLIKNGASEATFLAPRDGTLAPETYIDITHESLIREWRKMRDEWLPQEAPRVR